jgi:hypothetical protein
MRTVPSKPTRDLTRLVISGGKRAEPLFLMAHPMGETKRQRWLPVITIIALVVIIGLAGMSR